MRTIDADALKEYNRKVLSEPKTAEEVDCYIATIAILDAWVDSFPTIDAVPVVRCRDCEFWGTHLRTVGGKYGDCLNLERGTRADFYCGWGSRSDEAN